MDEEFLYDKVRRALEHLPENFNVLEEQIDVQLQMEYFGFAGKFRKVEDMAAVAADAELLFDAEASVDSKRRILVALASLPEVEAFRTIEKYYHHPDEGMKDWTTLAYQESRMLLQSSLLDEQQVFISTGLGGKGRKLRYFVVFMNREGTSFTSMQKKLLHDELRYALENNDGVLEEFNEMIDFTTALVILPIKASLKEIFRGVIEECNQYGNFLEEDMVITNVKRLSTTEIVDILTRQKEGPNDGEDSPESEGDDGDDDFSGNGDDDDGDDDFSGNGDDDDDEDA